RRHLMSNRPAGLLLFAGGALCAFLQISPAQTPARKPAAHSTGALKPAVEGNLAQVMRGIIYPASNVIFAAQTTNPADVKPAKDSATAPNPLESAYGKWEAVENAGLALSEAANLLILPGRKCSNGLPVPLQNANWAKFVQGLREAGAVTYKAAQSKDKEKILDATDAVAAACSNCHDKYRDERPLTDRCK
ncbi:MAG: cytochrome c, partial [Acidobacteriota bacterium]|nr:cytochrome c [Acidobacteriota bacterium]